MDVVEILSREQVINQALYISLIQWRNIEEDRGWKSEYMISLPPTLTHEIIEWVESNTIGKWNIIWSYWLEFEKESDVVAFKMRWI